eukprot:532080_1
MKSMISLMLFVAVYTIYGAHMGCHWWKCKHKRPGTENKCKKAKMSNVIDDANCIWNCGKPLVAANSGVSIVQNSIKGRVIELYEDNGATKLYVNWNHFKIGGQSIAQYLAADGHTGQHKLPVIRVDSCNAEYRYVLHITDPDKYPIGKSSADRQNIALVPQQHRNRVGEEPRHVNLMTRDISVKTPDNELKNWPYNTVGWLFSATQTCTMTLIAPNIGITGGHCVFNKQNKNWEPIKQMRFFPGTNNFWGTKGETYAPAALNENCGNKQNKCYKVYAFTVPLQFINSLTTDPPGIAYYYDWAIVELSRRTQNGYMAISKYVPPLQNDAYGTGSWIAKMAGYPLHYATGIQRKMDYPIYKRNSENRLTIDSVSRHKVIGDPNGRYPTGWSGSSIWRSTDNCIEAIFFGVVFPNDIQRDVGVRNTFYGAGIIDDDKYMFICSLLGQYKSLCT